jgi:electron transfer flavoprotein beta subunit
MSRTFRIIVCVRQALDWNMSTKDFRIDPHTQEPVVAFSRYRIDQFDEIAVEVALQARTGDGVDVHPLSVGPRGAEDVLKHALGMGAENAALVEHARASAPSVPGLLAAAIQRLGGAAVVLCGRTGSERGSGTTAPLLAELLHIPLVTSVVHIEKHERGWMCRREEAGGYERVLVSGPFVASVTNASFNIPRVPSLKDKMRAHRQKIETISSDALMADEHCRARGVAAVEVIRRYVPQTARQHARLSGDVAAQARALADYIHGAVHTL